MTKKFLVPINVTGDVATTGDFNASGRLEINGGIGASASYVQDIIILGALLVEGAAEFTSTVLLDADPTLPLQAATKQYVDALTAGVNEVFIGATDPGAAYELWIDTSGD